MADYQIAPKAGDYVKPDGWTIGGNLEPGDEPGSRGEGWSCQFRLPGRHYSLAVNIALTGFLKWEHCQDFHRVKIEFVGDGEPSTFSRGWLLSR